MLPKKTILDPIDVQQIQPDFACLLMIQPDQAKVLETVVFAREKQTLHILTTNSHPTILRERLSHLESQHFSYKLYYTTQEWINVAYWWYDVWQQKQQEQARARQAQQEAMWLTALQMIEWLYQKRNELEAEDFIMELVRLAFQAWASDLHFQAETKEILMRIRIDGMMKTLLRFSHEEFYRYGKKLKFIAGTKMNIEHIPQDGRFSFWASDGKWWTKKIDVRASFMPWIISENIVLRYLDTTRAIQAFDTLWFSGDNLTYFLQWLQANAWLIFVTWPTGSWKTTTLYSILDYKNDGTKKIITLEDPIEYQIPGIQQSQINYSKWYDYLTWLNAALRQDPDIILVWETRTKETAQTVVNAALTWHLVFTTLHTNNALEVIPRLISMGVQSYLLAPSLVMIIAQRLVRRVCPHCAKNRLMTDSEKTILEKIKNEKILSLFSTKKDIHIPVVTWCPQCNGTWYKGRIGIMEVLLITEEIRDHVRQNFFSDALSQLIQKSSFVSLFEDGFGKVLAGLTTIEELSRVL